MNRSIQRPTRDQDPPRVDVPARSGRRSACALPRPGCPGRGSARMQFTPWATSRPTSSSPRSTRRSSTPSTTSLAGALCAPIAGRCASRRRRRGRTAARSAAQPAPRGDPEPRVVQRAVAAGGRRAASLPLLDQTDGVARGSVEDREAVAAPLAVLEHLLLQLQVGSASAVRDVRRADQVDVVERGRRRQPVAAAPAAAPPAWSQARPRSTAGRRSRRSRDTGGQVARRPHRPEPRLELRPQRELLRLAGVPRAGVAEEHRHAGEEPRPGCGKTSWR